MVCHHDQIKGNVLGDIIVMPIKKIHKHGTQTQLYIETYNSCSELATMQTLLTKQI